MNIIKRLFGSRKFELNKPIVSGTFPKIADILNERQKDSAFLFYMNHRNKIDERIADTLLSYEPSQSEDKNDPRIWKDEHWKWFLANHR